MVADRAGKATKQVVKTEGWGGDSDDDDNVPISAINRAKKNKVEDSDDDDDDELPLATSRAKKKSAEGKKGGGVKGNAVPSKVKKEQSQDSKEDVKKKVKKDNSKGKENHNKRSSSGNVKTEKVKRVYELPGQKHDPPEERDPLRIFYETLYEQVPNSEMAAFWMMERGLLPEDEAEQVFKKKKQKGILSPAKPTSANKLPASNTTGRSSLDTCSTKKGKTGTPKDSAAKSKKRKADSDSEEDSDDDFVDAPKLNPRKRQKVSN